MFSLSILFSLVKRYIGIIRALICTIPLKSTLAFTNYF